MVQCLNTKTAPSDNSLTSFRFSNTQHSKELLESGEIHKRE